MPFKNSLLLLIHHEMLRGKGRFIFNGVVGGLEYLGSRFVSSNYKTLLFSISIDLGCTK